MRLTVENENGEKFLFRVPMVQDVWAITERLPLMGNLGGDGDRKKQPPKEAMDPEAWRALADKISSDPTTISEEELRMFTQRSQNAIKILRFEADFADQLLARCSIKPRLILDTPEDVPADTLCLAEMDTFWKIRTCQELQKHGKIDEDDATKSKEVGPLSETVAD